MLSRFWAPPVTFQRQSNAHNAAGCNHSCNEPGNLLFGKLCKI